MRQLPAPGDHAVEGYVDGAGQVRAYETDSGKQRWNLDLPKTGIFALACTPDGKTVAAGGADDVLANEQVRRIYLGSEFKL